MCTSPTNQSATNSYTAKHTKTTTLRPTRCACVQIGSTAKNATALRFRVHDLPGVISYQEHTVWCADKAIQAGLSNKRSDERAEACPILSASVQSVQMFTIATNSVPSDALSSIHSRLLRPLLYYPLLLSIP